MVATKGTPGRAQYKAPFPYFGGKSRIAEQVWQRFGAVQGYIEPFFGSGSVLLGRPQPFDGVETVNDADGLICNFWRALQAEPDAVAKWADNPVFENDCTARHLYLVEHKYSLQAKLEGDPDFYDVKIAGWWCHGMACWIGSGFCSGKGPWTAQVVDGVRQRVHLSDAGNGVNRQLVHLGNAGNGVNRKLVHLGDAGKGVNRKRVHLGDAGNGNGKAGCGEQGLLAWMQALAERLSRVRVCCGDWTRVCGGRSGDAISHFFASGRTCAVFLDPPYAAADKRDSNIYRMDSLTVADDVREWAIAHGHDKRLRIALCSYDSVAMPRDWTLMRWKGQGGLGNLGNGCGKANAQRECCWFSPHC